MNTETLKQVAEEFAQAFETRTRDNGDKFTCLKEHSPEWMTDVIRAAHGDMLPDDYKYRMISEIADSLIENNPDDWDESRHEIVDGLVDVYNMDRLRWLASDLCRASYCDDAAEEGYIGSEASMFERIGVGQYQEYQEIFDAVVEGLTEQAEAIDY